MNYYKKNVLKIILNAAKKYDRELKEKELLIVAKQEKTLVSYQIKFRGYHFKHFTGVESNLSANDFFKKALKNTLGINEFEFKDSLLVEKKMHVLENAMELPYSAKMVGNFKYAGIKIKADMGAGNSCYVMAFRTDDTNVLYPISVMEEDIRNSTQPTSPIFAILRKNKNEKTFEEITYISKNINISNIHIPKEISEMIGAEVFQQFKQQKKEEC